MQFASFVSSDERFYNKMLCQIVPGRSGAYIQSQNLKQCPQVKEQAISARERALCQLTACFEFQNKSDRRKGHKSCALEMVFRRKVRR